MPHLAELLENLRNLPLKDQPPMFQQNLAGVPTEELQAYVDGIEDKLRPDDTVPSVTQKTYAFIQNELSRREAPPVDIGKTDL